MFGAPSNNSNVIPQVPFANAIQREPSVVTPPLSPTTMPIIFHSDRKPKNKTSDSYKERVKRL